MPSFRSPQVHRLPAPMPDSLAARFLAIRAQTRALAAPLSAEDCALQSMPDALAQVRRTLLEAAAAGHVAAKQQIEEVAKQCDIWTDPARDDFWNRLASRTVEGLDQVKAEQIDYAAQKTASMRGENTLVTAEELVKVDGAQIHVG